MPVKGIFGLFLGQYGMKMKLRDEKDRFFKGSTLKEIVNRYNLGCIFKNSFGNTQCKEMAPCEAVRMGHVSEPLLLIRLQLFSQADCAEFGTNSLFIKKSFLS